MKKTIVVLLSFVLIFGLVGCGKKDNQYPGDTQILQDMQVNINTLPWGTEEVLTYTSTEDPVLDAGMLTIKGSMTRKFKNMSGEISEDEIAVKVLYRAYENNKYEYDSTLTLK